MAAAAVTVQRAGAAARPARSPASHEASPRAPRPCLLRAGGLARCQGPGSCGRLCSRERHPECGRFSTFPAHAGEITATFRSLPAEPLMEAAAGAVGVGTCLPRSRPAGGDNVSRDVKKLLGVAASPGNQKQWGEMHHCVQGTRNEWVSSAATTKALPARRCPERGWVRLTPALGRAGRVLSPATVSLPCGDGRAGTQTRGGDSVHASLRTRACLVQLPSFPQVSGGLTSSTWHVRQRPQATAEMQPRTRVAPGSDPGLRKSGKRPEK